MVNKNYISFSGGKDSMAMLLKMQQEKMLYDEIVFSDTGLEYSDLYEYLDYVEKTLGIDVKRINPPTFKAKELFDKNIKIRDKFRAQRIPSMDLEVLYPESWTDDTIITLWDFWFYGLVSSGANRGTVRGYPLVNSPCWYSREAKVNPLQRYMKDANNIYVGIASDEKKRLTCADTRVKHPLADFNMTEKDCAEMLQAKGLHNPIYDNYNRSGCFNCQKQGEWGLYALWKNSAKRFTFWGLLKTQWEQTVIYDNESRRVRGKGGFLSNDRKKELKLFELEVKFENGYVPENKLKFNCESCQVFGKHYGGEFD